jgi:predicted component of type VI protein secretion system
LNPWNETQEAVRQHPVGKLRLAVIVNELLRQEIVSAEDLFIRPAFSTRYNYEADASLQDHDGGPWFVETPQVGFYDRLPEQLFHKPVRPNAPEEAFQLIRREEEKQEQEGRRFLLPFDSRLCHFRAGVEKLELEALTGDNTALLRQLVALFWTPDFPAHLLTNAQLASVLGLLSVVHRIAGNLPACEAYCRDITGLPVRLTQTWQPLPVAAAAAGQGILGQVHLGTSSVLAGNRVETTYPVIAVRVGPVLEGQLVDFLPGGAWRRLVEALCELLFPVEAVYMVEPITEKAQTAWLGSKSAPAGRLGYSAYL